MKKTKKALRGALVYNEGKIQRGLLHPSTNTVNPSLQIRSPPHFAMASFDEAPPGNSKTGEKIFKTKCAQCHTVDKGAGHKQGFSLSLSLLAFLILILGFLAIRFHNLEIFPFPSVIRLYLTVFGDCYVIQLVC